MSVLSTIRAHQRILSEFRFPEPDSFAENFAQQRFLKKFHVPDLSNDDLLAETCFQEWLSNDESLPKIVLPFAEWYKTRSHLHENVGVPKFCDVGFPKGSEFSPTRGRNSLECKLSVSKWDSTTDAFPQFCRIAYHHKGLKRAFRSRYRKWYKRGGFDMTLRQSDLYLFKRFISSKDIGYSIFCWKMSRIVTFVQGSRFATVPKNNEKRRPINIEPFCNLVVQRTLGNWIRQELSRIYKIDLDTLASVQRVRISDVDSIATIDLKNASDSISLDLCRFLLPSRLMKQLEQSRSPFVFGLDGNFHQVKKISSMGNGFTFELMTLILTCVARQLDPESTVFGDDIIISKTSAPRLIELLQSVGLKVNSEKSFLDGPFRESCGANYHISVGYIESYDFLYPRNIGDCVVSLNKAYRLSLIYGSFRPLYSSLVRSLPNALHGGPSYDLKSSNLLDLISSWDRDDTSQLNFPLYFVTPKASKLRRKIQPKLLSKIRDLQLDCRNFNLVVGYEFKPKLRTPTRGHLKSNHWAKYEMYLASGRRCKDVLTSEGEWVQVWFINSGLRNFRVSSFELN